jgi:hypothetical protein
VLPQRKVEDGEIVLKDEHIAGRGTPARAGDTEHCTGNRRKGGGARHFYGYFVLLFARSTNLCG